MPPQTVVALPVGGNYVDIYDDTYAEATGTSFHDPDMVPSTGAQNIGANALASTLALYDPARLAGLSVIHNPTVSFDDFLSRAFDPTVIGFVINISPDAFTGGGVIYLVEVLQDVSMNALAAVTTVSNPAVTSVATEGQTMEAGAFYRHRSNTVLALVWGFDRTMHTGFWETEFWEKATDNFVFANSATVRASVEAAVASAWAANQTADLATLRTALHSALDSAGYLQPDGTALP